MSEAMIFIKNASTKVDHKGQADAGVRVYNSSPGLVTMQIRSNGPVAESGHGAIRPAFSGVQMSIEQIDQLIKMLQTARADARVRS